MVEENTCKNNDPRIRTLVNIRVNTCLNCRHWHYSIEVNPTLSKLYCKLDECVITWDTVCKDWEEDV